MNKPNRIEVLEYSLDTFVKTIEQNINNGYKLDFENNENYPIALGINMLTCGMVLKDVVPSKEIEVKLTVDTSEIVEQIKQVQLELDLEPSVEPEVIQQEKQNKPKRLLKK